MCNSLTPRIAGILLDARSQFGQTAYERFRSISCGFIEGEKNERKSRGGIK